MGLRYRRDISKFLFFSHKRLLNSIRYLITECRYPKGKLKNPQNATASSTNFDKGNSNLA